MFELRCLLCGGYYGNPITVGLHPLQHNPYTEPLWKAAVAQYERGVAPAELRIASKLRGKFQQLQAQPHQLLREFQKYQELIKRPNISKELTTERCVCVCVRALALCVWRAISIADAQLYLCSTMEVGCLSL